ncbi:hypothetical protein LTR91_025569 [Friedmanniomyces endolithicus]|uniref:Ubiquitin-like protease family profile domain-containing protein n=1 Tax=Friedmanniomyces endolithicus TaxID=329885 RepID=A0AAN6GZY7_9PEZI|nr:hypothetical protein LTR91_025569 [Friedmanniomyces endolithicus]KAK0951599.1 hypothetical protein LTS01_025186 [Friedmanniomyces endolithicus]
MSQERTLAKPRLTEEDRDNQAAVIDSAGLSSATKTSFASGKDASEHRQRTSGADRLPVADPSEDHHDGGDSKLLGQIRSNAQTLADELESQGQEIWTGAHPLIMLSTGFCKPRDLRLLASDGRLTDDFLNAIPVLGDCKDTDGYLLPTFVVQLITEARFKDLDRWTTGVPKQSKPWVFGLQESNHWMAVRIDWTGRLIQHYDPMHQKLTGRSRRILQHVEKWAKHRCGEQTIWRLEQFPGPVRAANDFVNCGVYVTWVLRHWVQNDDPSAANLTNPLAFLMEILRLLRLSPRVSLLPRVGEVEDQVNTTQTVPTEDSSEDDLESPTTVGRYGIEAGTLENLRVRQSPRPGEHRVELPPATSPSLSCRGEQRDEQTSSKPLGNAKDLQVDSSLSDHTALDARCDADATSVERLAHTADDQTQHTVETSANPADHARSCQTEYASDYREDFERMPREEPGLQPVQAAYGGLSMPASQGLLGTDGGQPSPGIAFCSHFEDALGVGFDSWYEPIEAAVQGVESLPASASMSDWDAWLQQ